MSLLTTPLVLNDGSSDHTFSFRAQQPDKKSVVADYIEDAATIASKSLIVVKHDTSGSVPRHLLQRTIYREPAAASDGVLRRITINLTVVADPLFTIAEVEEEFNIVRDLVDEADLIDGLLQNKI
jgi:hypothetical protein